MILHISEDLPWGASVKSDGYIIPSFLILISLIFPMFVVSN